MQEDKIFAPKILNTSLTACIGQTNGGCNCDAEYMIMHVPHP